MSGIKIKVNEPSNRSENMQPHFFARISFLAIVIFSLASCEALKERSVADGSARLLLYMHTDSQNPMDIEFKLSSVSLESQGGLVEVSGESMQFSSVGLVDRQILVKEAFVEPGAYTGIKIKIESATVRLGGERANLTLSDASGEAFFPLNLILKRGESIIVTMEWSPDSSIEKRVSFKPVIKFEPQRPSARELLLFVSNSGSNYISVIDRALERVIGAVTVGDKPVGMVLNGAKDVLYVVNSQSRTISEVDALYFNVRSTIFLAAGMMPTEVAFMSDSSNSTDGKLYVINRLSNDVTVVGTQSRRVLKTIPVGMAPSHIIADSSRKELYVANEISNSISIISGISDSLVGTVGVGSKPVGMVQGDGNIYVFNEDSKTVSVVSASARVVIKTIPLIDSPHRGFKGFNGKMFVLNSITGTMTFLDSQDIPVRTIASGSNPVGITGDETRNRLYVTNSGADTVSILDPFGEVVIKELMVGKGPFGIVILER